MVVLESALLLKFIPFLMKDVEGFGHRKLLQEVSDEIIDDHVTLQHLRLGLRLVSLH